MSTSNVKRAYVPSILLQIQKADGSVIQLRCTKQQLSELRLQLALCLREVLYARCHPWLRISDAVERDVSSIMAL